MEDREIVSDHVFSEAPEDRITRRVLNEVARERRMQDAKWGEQNHAPPVWVAILVEEVGEAAREALAVTFGAAKHGKATEPLLRYRAELVQCAAVAVAAIEALDRMGESLGEEGGEVMED